MREVEIVVDINIARVLPDDTGSIRAAFRRLESSHLIITDHLSPSELNQPSITPLI